MQEVLMDKKSVATTIAVIFSALVFAVIGICFSTFVYSDTKIEVQNIKIAAAESIKVYGDKDLKEEAKELKLSAQELGLKPATGELDEETQIPSTITNQGTSEGYYASVFVKTNVNYKIVVKDIKIETKHSKIEAEEERKNIFISIMDVANSTKNLKENEVEIAKFEDQKETQELVFLIWLGSLSGEELEGAKISFTINFIPV